MPIIQSSLLHSVNLILFTVLLVHLILHTILRLMRYETSKVRLKLHLFRLFYPDLVLQESRAAARKPRDAASVLFR